MDNKVFDFHEIKTFADACEKLGMKEHLLTGSMGGDREAQGQAQALYKLLIIQKAINNGMILLNEETDYDLLIEVPTYNRDYSNFIPQKWQPCLVRESIYDHWKVRVCADNKQQVTFYDSSNCCSGDILWDFKLPLSKITERLIGTTKSYKELIKELDGYGQD